MKFSDSAWKRLAAAARQAPVEGDMAAPYGFATRVVALALSSSRPAPSLVQQFSLRALLAAAALAIACVALNVGPVLGLIEEDPVTTVTETAGQIQYEDLS